MSEPVATRDPFGPTSSASDYVPRPATDQAFSRLERAVLDEGLIALVQGPGGLGKTLLLRRLAESARRRLTPVYLPYASLTPEELASWTLEALGANAVDDAPTMFRMWVAHLQSEGSPLLILVDDATALPAETARWLVQLAKEGSLRLAMAAIEGLGTVLRDELPDDVEFIRLADPMSADESRDYLAARLAMAEIPEEQRAAFDAAAFDKLYRISRGNPRRLHHAAGALLRGAEPDSIGAFLDGAEPAVEAREEAAERVKAAAALAAERLAVREALEAEAGDPEEDPAAEAEPETEEEPLSEEQRLALELAAREIEAAAEGIEAAAEEVEAHPEFRAGEPESPAASPVPEASWVREEALEANPVLLRDSTFQEGPQQQPLPEPAVSDEPTAELDESIQEAAGALLEATAILREATVALGEPGTPRGNLRGALRETVEALSDAIAASEQAGAQTRGSAAYYSEPGSGVVAAAFRRVAVVVGGSALLGASVALYFVGLGDTEPLEAPAAVTATASAPEPEVFEIGINATPWASVEIDGKAVGETPIAGLRLEAGLHVFRARMPDGRIVVRRVQIGPETRTLVFR